MGKWLPHDHDACYAEAFAQARGGSVEEGRGELSLGCHLPG